MPLPDKPGGDLSVLFPAPQRVEIAGRWIEISQAGIRHGQEVIARAYALAAKGKDDADEVLLAEDEAEEAADLIAFALGVDRDWALSLSPLEKIDVALAWLKVNRDFFFQRLPLARKRLRAEMAEIFGAGPMPSIISPAEGTPELPTTLQPLSADGSQPQPQTSDELAKAA